jgi:hypothetical protein
VSTLGKAQDELRQRAWLADERQPDEAALWWALVGVADYLRRIADHGVTSHYRAEKAGDLVNDALRVKSEALTLYAHGGDDWSDLLVDLHHGVAQLVAAIDVGAWAAARGEAPQAADVRAMHGALTFLGQLVNRLGARAPDGEP